MPIIKTIAQNNYFVSDSLAEISQRIKAARKADEKFIKIEQPTKGNPMIFNIDNIESVEDT